MSTKIKKGADALDYSPLSSLGQKFLLFSAFCCALCGMNYELLLGTLGSYFLGDSVQQFSLTIGIFMTSMGLGAFLARFVDRQPLQQFLKIQFLLGIVGSLCTPLLYYHFAWTGDYALLSVLFNVIIGSLIGCEIPLLTQILMPSKQSSEAENSANTESGSVGLNIFSNILALDYLGGFAAALLFPFILLPKLGTMRTSLLMGIINLLLAFIGAAFLLKNKIRIALLTLSGLSALVFSYAYSQSDWLMQFWQDLVYKDKIVLSAHSRFQNIVFTTLNGHIKLFIDGHLQFNAADEYRYHETIVHVPMSFANGHFKKIPENVLLLGAGDGLAIREILKYSEVKKITLVDLDPLMTQLARTFVPLRELNQNSLLSSKVQIINEDAFTYLQKKASQQLFDLVIIDLPDPNNTGLAKLYTQEFYASVRNHLSAYGLVMVQTTSPFFAKQAFWCAFQTISSVMPQALALHAYVPSFGEWGFALASNSKASVNSLSNINNYVLPPDVQNTLKYFSPAELGNLFFFSKDMQLSPIEQQNLKLNRLNELAIMPYYLEAWKAYK